MPPSDPCERALKQYTALLLNIESNRLQETCDIDPAAAGCSSTAIDQLVGELAGLITSGDPDDCKLVTDCAGAVNEGLGIVLLQATPSAPGSGISDLAGAVNATPTTSPSDTPRGGGMAYAAPVGRSAPAEAGEPPTVEQSPILVVRGASGHAAPESDRATDERAADAAADLTTIDGHLSVLTSAAAPQKVRKASEDALLTALGGGYEPQVRLRIVRVLFGQVDVAYHSLLAKHLADIRDEAWMLGHKDMAREAARLLKRLGASVESAE